MTQNSSQLDRIEAVIFSLTEAVQVTNANINRLNASVELTSANVNRLNASVEVTNANINNLVEHLFTRRDVVELDVLDIKNDLHELKEITKQQNVTADRYAVVAQTQADSVKLQAENVKLQAENIRLLIELLNRKQA